MQLEELAPRAAEAEAFLKAMANRYRLMILCQLHQVEKSVAAFGPFAGRWPRQDAARIADDLLFARDPECV